MYTLTYPVLNTHTHTSVHACAHTHTCTHIHPHIPHMHREKSESESQCEPVRILKMFNCSPSYLWIDNYQFVEYFTINVRHAIVKNNSLFFPPLPSIAYFLCFVKAMFKFAIILQRMMSCIEIELNTSSKLHRWILMQLSRSRMFYLQMDSNAVKLKLMFYVQMILLQ